MLSPLAIASSKAKLEVRPAAPGPRPSAPASSFPGPSFPRVPTITPTSPPPSPPPPATLTLSLDATTPGEHLLHLGFMGRVQPAQ